MNGKHVVLSIDEPVADRPRLPDQPEVPPLIEAAARLVERWMRDTRNPKIRFDDGSGLESGLQLMGPPR